MKVFGKNLATAGIALVGVGAIAVAPTVQAPPRPVPAVQLAAATSPTVVQPLAGQSNYLGAFVSLDLGRFLVPPSAANVFPTPPGVPGPSPAPTKFEFEDAIINTYEAIEPWVQYGFEVATYAVGWIPWVGWLAPQIMIFYHWLEPVVHSLVVNSANWLWGPLPFFEGVGNIAEDSWYAFGNFLRMQWDFWLPPLPPLPPWPGSAQSAETQLLAAAEALAPADQLVTSLTAKPHPLQDLLVALHRLLPGPDPVAQQNVAALVDNLREALNAGVANLPAALTEDITALRATLKEDIANLRAVLRGDVIAGPATIESRAATATPAGETQLESDNGAVVDGAVGADQSSTESDKSGHRFGRGERFHHVRGLVGRGDAAADGQRSTKDRVSSAAEEQGAPEEKVVAAGGEAQSNTPARGNKLRPGRLGGATRADDVKKDEAPARGDSRGRMSGQRDESSGKPRKSSENPSGPSAKRSHDSADKGARGKGPAGNDSGDNGNGASKG